MKRVVLLISIALLLDNPAISSELPLKEIGINNVLMQFENHLFCAFILVLIYLLITKIIEATSIHEKQIIQKEQSELNRNISKALQTEANNKARLKNQEEVLKYLIERSDGLTDSTDYNKQLLDIYKS